MITATVTRTTTVNGRLHVSDPLPMEWDDDSDAPIAVCLRSCRTVSLEHGTTTETYHRTN